jgi:geranylgeranyl diphosphate synthase type II
MIRVSLIIGATIANATAEQIESLKAYGAALGLLFQVTDDLLDVTATDEQRGKRTHNDSVKGKMTYPGLLGVEASQAYAAELTQKAKDALSSFGQDAELLRNLADYVLERNH